MANNTHDRTIINVREKPLSNDWDQLQSQMDRTLRDVLLNMLGGLDGAAQSGFLSDSFQVQPTSPAASMNVTIEPGIGYLNAPADTPSAIGGIAGVDDLSPYKPLVIMGAQQVAIDAAPVAGQNRIDIIEVAVTRVAGNPSNRKILDANPSSPTYGTFQPGLVNKTLTFVLDGLVGRVVSPAPSTTGIGYKVGTAVPAGTETAPATTPGYVKIAEVLVTGGSASIVAAAITDRRSVLPIGPGGTGVYTTAPAAPISGTWPLGAIVLNSQPVPGAAIGWRCVTAGTPGTWESLGVSGTRVQRTILTAGSGNFVTSSKTRSIVVTVVGGGGAGGSVGTGSSTWLAGAGGGAGGYVQKQFAVSPLTSCPYSVGAGALYSTSPFNSAKGGDGSNSTFQVGATTITATGGTGGSQGSTTGAGVNGGAGGAWVTGEGGDVNIAGQSGGAGLSNAAFALGGPGGSSPLGVGGALGVVTGTMAQWDGSPGQGFGSGGGGAAMGTVNTSGGHPFGGSGMPGVIIIDEYT